MSQDIGNSFRHLSRHRKPRPARLAVVSKAQLVITAVVLEGRSQTDVARDYGVSKSWVSKLVTRYREHGNDAFTPRSRRPKTSPQRLPDDLIDRITTLRHELSHQGLDAGPSTIAWHLATHHHTRVSPATISRHLTRLGLVEPQPRKRPRSSYIRFQAAMPNQTWQSDVTHYRLTTGTEAKILTWLDDCSRYALSVTAHHSVTAPVVLASFRHTTATHGTPASTLTDNGMVYTTRFAGGKGGRSALEPNSAASTSPEERPTQPPHHLRQSRTLPADPQELAPPANPPPRHDRSSTNPTRRLHDHLQPPPPPPIPPPQRHPPRSTPPTPKPAPPATANTTPTTASAATPSTKSASSPSASTAASTTSVSAETTPTNASSCSCKTSTSASSTPAPANSYATSPSTPPATTNPPARQKDPNPK